MESRESDQGSVCSEFREKVESGPGLVTEIGSKMMSRREGRGEPYAGPGGLC